MVTTKPNNYIEAVRMKCYALETEMLKRGLLFTVDTFVYAFNHGIICTIRASRGEDIMAACGLLAGQKCLN